MTDTTTTDRWTPGPWMVDQRAATHVVGAGERHVCTTGGYSSNHPSDRDTHIDENEANARLISLAPELVEALREVLVAHGIRHPSESLYPRLDARIRALLARLDQEAS